MNIDGKTDKGIVRDSNQDAYDVGEFSNGSVWAVLCDGMGGANGGSVASKSAVEDISEQLKLNFRDELNSEEIKNILIQSIEHANSKIHEKAHNDELLSGMGTTVVAMIIDKGTVYVTHAGDSRAYLIGESGMEQLTVDHSMVQMMLNNGDLTPEEAKEHPRKHIITRAVGVNKTIEIDFTERQMSSGDVVLLCSDGLSNYVESAEVEKVIKEDGCEKACEKLTELAYQHGGGDNITIVLVWE